MATNKTNHPADAAGQGADEEELAAQLLPPAGLSPRQEIVTRLVAAYVSGRMANARALSSESLIAEVTGRISDYGRVADMILKLD